MDLSDIMFQINTSVKRIKDSFGIKQVINLNKPSANQNSKPIQDNYLDPGSFYAKNFSQNGVFESFFSTISKTWEDHMQTVIQIALTRYGYKDLKDLCAPMSGFGTNREDGKDKVIEEYIGDFWKDFRNIYFNNQGNLDSVPTISEVKRFYRQELKEAKLCLKAHQD